MWNHTAGNTSRGSIGRILLLCNSYRYSCNLMVTDPLIFCLVVYFYWTTFCIYSAPLPIIHHDSLLGPVWAFKIKPLLTVIFIASDSMNVSLFIFGNSWEGLCQGLLEYFSISQSCLLSLLDSNPSTNSPTLMLKNIAAFHRSHHRLFVFKKKEIPAHQSITYLSNLF